MSDETPAARRNALFIFTIVISFIVGCLFGSSVENFHSGNTLRAEAVREGHAHYEPDKDGKPEFKWNPRCGEKK